MSICFAHKRGHDRSISRWREGEIEVLVEAKGKIQVVLGCSSGWSLIATRAWRSLSSPLSPMFSLQLEAFTGT